MKKSALPALLLAGLMLVSCDAGMAVLTGTSAPTRVLSTTAPTTNLPASTEAVTTAEPVTTTAHITYPTLYLTPETTDPHDDVVPVQAIEKMEKGTNLYGETKDLPLYAVLADLEECSYIIALVTPLELNTQEATIRIAIDYVYEEHIPDTELWNTPDRDRERIYSEETPVYYGSYMYGFGRRTNVAELTYYENEIPITTTGGKYVMILTLQGFIACGEDGCTSYYYLIPTLLTWELDPANVPGSTGDSWNRPPYIGRAENYYAFGFGDVWERYMAD